MEVYAGERGDGWRVGLWGEVALLAKLAKYLSKLERRDIDLLRA
jgi:hypothetical protein